MSAINPILLLILDGWGIDSPHPYNAIHLAQPQYFNYLWQQAPHTTLQASGSAVGLESHTPGNTDAGHQTIGVGQPIPSVDQTIVKQIQSGDYFKHPQLQALSRYLHTHQARLHILHILDTRDPISQELRALIRFCKEAGIADIALHLIIQSNSHQSVGSQIQVNKLQQLLHKHVIGSIATVTGARWVIDQTSEDLQPFISLFTSQPSRSSANLDSVFQQHYNRGLYDDQIPPTVIRTAEIPVLAFQPPDVLFLNQTQATGLEGLLDLITGQPQLPDYNQPLIQPYHPFRVNLSLGELHPAIPSLYQPITTEYSLGQQISQLQLAQLRITTTDKQDAVTSRLNGNHLRPYHQEDRVIVPHNSQHHESLNLISKQLQAKLATQFYSFVAANLPHVDTAAHTCHAPQVQAAVQHIDHHLQHIVPLALKHGYTVILTADHGHAETLDVYRDQHHTTNPVPFIFIPSPRSMARMPQLQTLADIHPYILSQLNSHRTSYIPYHENHQLF